ncbi:MAG TPA: 16S rRNA (cytosine(967)-C(5))-methyltransferase RsmB [Casimicrobiaceae bacterium]|nr:16S rRNA (cytosine(967)-C(5))-methyltransferase RsmB [Casimicrobiaceae bacterium]
MHREQTLAALAVMRVFEGTRLRDALALVDEANASRGRALVHELAYGTLRHWGTLDAIVDRLARKPIADPLLRMLVTVALYQLEYTRAPAFAVVDRAVHAAGAGVRPEAKGLVNALLRRFLRERDEVLRAVLQSDVARFSYPRWWIERARRDHPNAWQPILEAGNAHAPLTLRVNRRETSRAALARRFAEACIASREVNDDALILATPRPVVELPGFAEGVFSVQDLAAQHAAPLLDVRDGMRVLDACAAPGGKTTHLLEIADVDVLAIDSDPTRIAWIEENVARLRLGERRLQLVQGDAGDPSAWWDGRPFDRILLDAPCTASGVVRRHPDAKWRHRESDVERFAREQDRLLDALWPLLARDGKIVYATCSVFAAENQERAAAFTARHGDALRETVNLPAGSGAREGQLLPSPEGASHNQDGFFYALFGKR